MPRSTITSVPIKNNAARYAAALYSVSSRRRITSPSAAQAHASHFLVRVDYGLAVRAGLFGPLRCHRIADLLELAGERRRGWSDGHAVLGQLLQIPLGFFLGELPAARFGIGGGLQHRVLSRLVERRERLLVDEHDVLRQPGLRIIEILHLLPCLGVVT